MPSSSPQENNSFLNRFFTHNPQTIHDEIRATLNSGKSPTGYVGGSSSTLQENVESVFQSLGFGSTTATDASASSTAATTTTSSVSTWKLPQKKEQEVEFETKPSLHNNKQQLYKYAAPHQRSSYQIHQGNQQISVEVNATGLSKDDLKVEVLNMPACVVQWSTTSANNNNNNNNSHRLRLGSSVDCQQLSANLHQGVLRMKAPLKTEPVESSIKTIPITTGKE